MNGMDARPIKHSRCLATYDEPRAVLCKMLAICVVVLASSCGTPLKTKRYGNKGSKVDQSSAGQSNRTQLNQNNQPNQNNQSEPTDTRESHSSSAYTSTPSRTITPQDSSVASERKRILPLREQIERVQQEQAALHARIDSVRDELRELREVRQPSPSRLIAGESKKQQSLPVERNTSSSTLSSVATTDPFDDVIAPDGDEVPSNSAPKKISSRSGTRGSSAASLSSRASGASRASTSKEIAKRPEVASTKDVNKDKETSTANKSAKGSSGPADVVDLFAQAMELFKRKQYAECITLLQKSNARSASTESLARNSYWIGESCFGLGKYEDAIRWYKKALGYPAFDRASGSMLMIAESYVRMGKNSEAKKSYERVVKTYPKSAEAVRALKRLQQI